MDQLIDSAKKFGLKVDYSVEKGCYTMNVIDYIRATAGMKDKFRVVNMPLSKGVVYINPLFLRKILSEKFKQSLMGKKYTVPVEGDSLPIDGCIPPCIKHTMYLLNIGTNLTHFQRFTLASFLLKIGWSVKDIIPLFSTSPDYDINATSYYVRHIRDGNYTPPSCSTMRRNGMCVREEGCGVNHPLNYYKRRGVMRVR